jgi:hypothetical protein
MFFSRKATEFFIISIAGQARKVTPLAELATARRALAYRMSKENRTGAYRMAVIWYIVNAETVLAGIAVANCGNIFGEKTHASIDYGGYCADSPACNGFRR